MQMMLLLIHQVGVLAKNIKFLMQRTQWTTNNIASSLLSRLNGPQKINLCPWTKNIGIDNKETGGWNSYNAKKKNVRWSLTLVELSSKDNGLEPIGHIYCTQIFFFFSPLSCPRGDELRIQDLSDSLNLAMVSTIPIICMQPMKNSVSIWTSPSLIAKQKREKVSSFLSMIKIPGS